MKQFESRSVSRIIDKINQDTNELIERSNTASTSLYNTLHRSTTDLQTIKKKVAILGDMMTDLNIISGNTKTIYDFSDLDIVKTDGVTMENGSIFLSKIKEQLVEFSMNTSSILSDKPYLILDDTNTSKTINDLFKYKTNSTIKVNTIGYDFKFVLNFAKISKINQIIIELSDTPESYPIIEGVTALAKDSLTELPVQIQNNRSNVYSLDENRVIGNRYVINIDTVDTKTLSFNLFSRESDRLKISSISVMYSTYRTNGSIILGPIISEHSILKAGMSCLESSDNATLQLSTDMEEWINVVDSFRVSTEGDRKIVAFNTINETSFKTDEDIHKLYIKISLDSKRISSTFSDVTSYDAYREDGVVSRTYSSEEEDTRFSAYRISDTDLIYGGYVYNSGLEIGKSLRGTIANIAINGEDKILGFNDTGFSVGTKDSIYNNVALNVKELRLPASVDIDASEFDAVGANLIDINIVPFEEDFNTLTRNDLCLKLKEKEDDYRLIAVDSNRSIPFSVSSSFVRSSSTLLLQVPYEDIKLVNSLGEIVHVYSKEKHLIKDDIYLINLINILYELPTVSGFSYNELYPLEENKEDEYSLDNGQLRLGKGSIVKYKGHRLIETTINKKLTISYQNGNIWERLDKLYTYFHSQVDRSNIEKSVIKLDHRSIEKGSLSIYASTSYETLVDDPTYLSVSNTYINSNSYITEEKNSDIFIKE